MLSAISITLGRQGVSEHACRYALQDKSDGNSVQTKAEGGERQDIGY